MMSEKMEEMLIELLADTIPSDPCDFNSEAGDGSPQHCMTLPYNRSLDITYEETGDSNSFYSWVVNCNKTEFDNDVFHGTLGVMDQMITNDIEFDTKVAALDWAVRVAMEKSIV